MAELAEPRHPADRPLALVSVVIFWLGFGAMAGAIGNLPLIADTWSFPYDLERVGWREILLFFDRQPPGFLAYVKGLSSTGGHLLDTIVIGNGVMFSMMLYLSYFALVSQLGRLGALLTCSWLATGLEFHLYTAFTRYEMASALLVVLLLAAHQHGHGQRVRQRSTLVLITAPLAATVLALCRSFFIYFFFCYALLSALLLWRQRRQRRMVGWRGAAVATTVLLLYAAVPALMAKNALLYDHATVSSWTYESVQRSVRAQLKINDVYQDDAELYAYIAGSPHVADESKRVFELGARWPLRRRDVAAAIDEDAPFIGYLREQHPRAGYDDWLYQDARSRNGYLFGPALHCGHDVAMALLRDEGWWMLPSMVWTSSQLATCYSGYWFLPGYGRYNCRRLDPGILYDPQGELEPQVTWLGHDDPSGFDRVRHAYSEVFPDPLLASHLVFHRLLAILVVASALIHVLIGTGRVIRRRRLAQGPFLVAAVIAYCYLVSVFGDYGENMRFGFYWKLPAVWYGAWLARQAVTSWKLKSRKQKRARAARKAGDIRAPRGALA